MNRPILTIVRGLPGSGKSAYARNLAAKTGAMLIEPDALLVTGGEYRYTPEMYKYACNQAYCICCLVAEMKVDAIYADVLSKVSDVHFLARSAFGKKEYTLRVIDMPLLTVEESIARNRHDVRREDIERMAATWEPWEEGK